MDNSQAVYPQNAYSEFNGTTYQAHPEVLGNVVDTEKTLQVLRDTIASGKTELNLSDAGCYIAPEITSKSQSLLDQIALLDKYVPFALTYTFTDGTTEQLSGQTVFGWLAINEDGSYTVNEDAVSAWLDDFCNRHTTVGRERTFTSVDGNTYTVSGGTYGWSVDYDQEYESILNMLNTKQSETREPYWGRTAAVNNATGTEPDWGDTYLDLNLTTQHVYYIQGGQLVFDADVVTGLPDAKHRTPDGVYYISEKLSPKTLTGEIQSNGEPEYKTVVKYWMRVTNSGVGFHDATWQSAFGGTRYITHGSHGCINMSYSEVAELYSMVEVGCPVVSHY